MLSMFKEKSRTGLLPPCFPLYSRQPRLGPNTRLLICGRASGHQVTVPSPQQETHLLLHQAAVSRAEPGAGPCWGSW